MIDKLGETIAKKDMSLWVINEKYKPQVLSELERKTDGVYAYIDVHNDKDELLHKVLENFWGYILDGFMKWMGIDYDTFKNPYDLFMYIQDLIDHVDSFGRPQLVMVIDNAPLKDKIAIYRIEDALRALLDSASSFKRHLILLSDDIDNVDEFIKELEKAGYIKVEGNSYGVTYYKLDPNEVFVVK
nr:MAG: hypothetical protein TU36_01635 [Vulcanisaeta sp. AZ3]